MSARAGMQTTRSDNNMETQQSKRSTDEEQIEGLDTNDTSLGDYPIDDLLIRNDSRTIRAYPVVTHTHYM